MPRFTLTRVISPTNTNTQTLTGGGGAAALAAFAGGQLVVTSQTHAQRSRRLLGHQPALGGTRVARHDATVSTVMLKRHEDTINVMTDLHATLPTVMLE